MNAPKEPLSCKPDPHDASFNNSDTEHFESVLQTRLSRRALLRGGAATAAGAALGSMGLAGCGGGEGGAVAGTGASTVLASSSSAQLMGFQAVAKSLADAVSVPAGYTASVLYALGDPLTSATPAYRNNGTDTDFTNRSGDHHDGMEYFGLFSAENPMEPSSDRGVLVINHEATTEQFGTHDASFFLHADGGTATFPRPVSEMDKEVAVHGLSVVEVKKDKGKWRYVKDSPYNRRITPLTATDIHGPVRGNALLVTRYSPDGTRGRGTVNNCGCGKTPWGTYLTGEENFPDYFFRVATEARDRSAIAQERYGRFRGAVSRYHWARERTGDYYTDGRYERWDISATGASAGDDYRNEMNTFGYMVEVDPYDKNRAPRKRTALGRILHESAAFGRVVVDQPVAAYMGDDARNEYIYKYVSDALWRAQDAKPAPPNLLTVGDRYLDSGKLYVAKFNADGSGQWLPLSLANPAVAAGAGGYTFDNQADVLVHARLAADAAGATRMDRPEWAGINPANGEIYVTLTNNSRRVVQVTSSGRVAVDSANPRVYFDASSGVNGNPNGHILRMREGADGNGATSFTWDVYLFGAEADVTPAQYNLSNLTGDQDFSSPDCLAFSKATGLCWFHTDDGNFTSVTNCMLMASQAGAVGDGGKVTLSYPLSTGGTLAIDTWVGRSPAQDQLKRFLVGPKECEITGMAETPDGKTLFVNIQHPGEFTAGANVDTPNSRWPGNAGYGPGVRPRSATVVITRVDGGVVGS